MAQADAWLRVFARALLDVPASERPLLHSPAPWLDAMRLRQAWQRQEAQAQEMESAKAPGQRHV
jgi:hypothetical protein